MATKKISQIELNRATLDRQMLLERKSLSPLRAIEKLCGLQAQVPRPPQIGLWTRIDGFDSKSLHKQLISRKVVRATSMRCTIHLMTARDFLAFRPCLQSMLTKAMKGALGKRVANLDPQTLVRPAKKFFKAQPGNFKDLVDHLGPQFPKLDKSTLRYVVRTNLPLIQIPTDVPWSFKGHADFATVDDWLGTKVDMKTDETALFFRRYLSAFGPASIADFRAWSGLAGCHEVADSRFGKLMELENEEGRVLFDLPRARRPVASTPAPVRFLPDYDNLIMAFQDRSRVIPDEFRSRLCTKNLRVLPTILIDGQVAGTWDFQLTKKTAEILVNPFIKIKKSQQRELVAEGEDLLRFAQSDLEPKGVQIGKVAD